MKGKYINLITYKKNGAPIETPLWFYEKDEKIYCISMQKRYKIKQIALLLHGALLGEKLVGLKMNVPQVHLKKVVSLLPSLNAPTIASLYESDWFSVETVVNINVVRDLIPDLLAAGAEGIIEYPLNKVV